MKLARVSKPPVRSNKRLEVDNEDSGIKNIYVYQGDQLDITDNDIKSTLEKRFPYYISLSADLKEIFEKRLRRFMSLKTFIIPETKTYKDVPILMSATAVQLTFGLKEFELPWYQYIRIHSEEYFANDPNALRVLAGHVENNIITIAWNQFLKTVL